MKVHLIFLPHPRSRDSTEIKPREVIEIESLPPIHYASYWKVDGEFWRVKDFTVVSQRDSGGPLFISHGVITLQLTMSPAKKPEKRLKLVE